ncbi:MAG: anthranilate phosphoribosyltransferase [Planctomycetaceae bacterium]|nr:anthranilate phosphoribosyltransferase [Planctomycetaceae bacterium]
MQPVIRNALDLAIAGQAVPADDMQAAVEAIMKGKCSETETSVLLTALRMKGETVEEIVGAARAMREHVTRVKPKAEDLLDTCGTGGDALQTFNISTAVAFVVAACGVPIAKHGNRSVSSSSGSADVLEELGINVEITPRRVATCIDKIGIGFCYARTLHKAMKHVAPIRAELGFRTIFNLLGPLTNPAGAPRQLIGANKIATAELLAHAALQLGTKRTIVVCGNDELDEVSLWGETTAFGVSSESVKRGNWTCLSFGLDECTPGDLRVSSPAESADRIRAIFEGETGPSRDIVLANAAVALIAAERVPSPRAGVERAAAAIDEGRAKDVLEKLAKQTS